MPIFYTYTHLNKSDKQHPQSGCFVRLNITGIHSIRATTYFKQLPTATYIKVSYIILKMYWYSLAFLANTSNLILILKATEQPNDIALY